MSAATINRYKEMQIGQMEWEVSDPCPKCAMNAGQVVPIGGTFNSGNTQPPAHPNCRCALLPVIPDFSEDIPEGDYICALDQAEVVREGKHITILTYSRMRHHCLKAVQQLEADGIDVELIDLISLKPFDLDTITRSIRKTHRVLVVEECMKTGGIGAELLALITEHCFDDLDARPVRLSSQDIPTPYNGKLENLTIIQPHQIVEAARQITSGVI
jgi:pyruvate dehydrogenase E1 component beta subunit